MTRIKLHRWRRGARIAAAVLALTATGEAGVTVVENGGAMATSWPGMPILQTVSNPSSASVVESFNGGSGNTNLSETFTATTNFTLQTIDLYAGTGSGTGAGTNLVLRLFDLGTQSAPNPSAYAGAIMGGDLLGSGAGLSVSYSNQATGILEFDFTGPDQVTLTSGHMYAFELNGVLNSKPVFWLRGTTDTFSGGAAYRNESWINATNGRDFAMAIYAVGPSNAPQPFAASSTVDWNDVHQRIDGFGGGVVFLNPGSLDPVTSANMDTLFGTATTNQLGLSLLRVRIDPNTNWANALLDGQKAVARGARVLATPWTPPPGMKDNTNIVEGSLLPAQYSTYASYLNGFAAYMGTNGAPLAAISLQNEPDANVSYESAVWTPTEFQTFCHNNAGAITNAPVLMPESESYNTSFSEPTLNDPVAAANISYIAGHLYGNGNAGATIVDYPNAHNKGKPTWMTEFLVNDQTIGTAITTAKQVHDCLTVGNMSAYIWWKCLGDANGLVDASGNPQKRGFVLAQWSRFVHTNYYRIGASAGTVSSVSAYKDPVGLGFAMVAINTNASTSVIQTFNLTNFNTLSVTPWITSATLSLGVQSPVNVSNGSFTYTLPPQSIITFAGQALASNTPPTLMTIADQTVNAGIFVMVTNVAVDTDAPPQTLTFSLLNGPGSLNLSNGVFTWRPPVSRAGTTNRIVVEVADNGTPSLGATNGFNVIVNPMTPVTLGVVSVAPGQVNFSASGPQGPDYTVMVSTDLLNWQVWFTTNSPATPFSVVDTSVGVPTSRFYRIQLGP